MRYFIAERFQGNFHRVERVSVSRAIVNATFLFLFVNLPPVFARMQTSEANACSFSSKTKRLSVRVAAVAMQHGVSAVFTGVGVHVFTGNEGKIFPRKLLQDIRRE